MVSGGSYCLCIKVRKEIDVGVGALGALSFPPGTYVYVGSALNGLEARVRRHLRTSLGRFRALHWHVDYLLKEPDVILEAVYVKGSEEREECAIAEAVSQEGTPVHGFGSGDCRCESHLFRVEDCEFLEKIGLEKVPLCNFQK